jgi:mannose-6-phosphate isomerase-like protein (cupin superfamily)
MKPYVADIEAATKDNTNFRTVLWTGEHSQLTVMDIKPGEDIGLEVHPDNDQFLRVEQGKAHITFGPDKNTVTEEHDIEDDWAIIVPAGTWHNVINTGDESLKVYSVYSPADHPAGAIHETKADAEAAEPKED